MTTEAGRPAAPPRRLLFLAPFPPRRDATHGGSRAIAELVHALAGRHRVGLLYLTAADDPPVDPLLEQRCDLIVGAKRPSPAGRSGRLRHQARLAAALLRGQPLWVSGWGSPELLAVVRRVARDWRPDLVQLEYHLMGRYLPALHGVPAPRVLRQLEPGTASSLDREAQRRGAARLASRLDRWAWARYERRLMREVQAVVALTERDEAALRQLAPDAPIVRIPLDVPVPAQALNPSGHGRPSVLFVGSYSHPPNADAAERLVRGIFPPVRRELPEAALSIVGADPPAGLGQRGGEGVEVTGRVPDVTPYLDAAAVFAAPLRLGGGMRVKVLEALAAGKAVVASPRAVDGLSVANGKQVVLAETDEEFATAIVELLREPQRRLELARRAREWATANLGQERTTLAFEHLYDTLLR
ncbi:MAG TPA: glycosyltransferase [Gemmatimonadales bacterium]|nr:glycosyltransferase [Gemmatimonadales bacterium]